MAKRDIPDTKSEFYQKRSAKMRREEDEMFGTVTIIITIFLVGFMLMIPPLGGEIIVAMGKLLEEFFS